MVTTRGEERIHFVEEKKHKGVITKLKETLDKQSNPPIMSSLEERQIQRRTQAIPDSSKDSDEIELE